MYGNSESKPALNPTTRAQPSGLETKDNAADFLDLNEDRAGLLVQPLESLESDDVIQSSENERVNRETPTLPNPCVTGYKLKLIDRKRAIPTAVCAEGCKAVIRVIYLPEREAPFIFVADCKKM